jgi:hypothetical protein
VRKLLVAPVHALGRYVSRELWATFSLLRERHGWHLLETTHLPSNGDLLPPLLQYRIGGWPDVVLFWESYPFAARYTPEFQAHGARVFVMTDDLHHSRDGMARAVAVADGVLSTYAPRFSAFFPSVDASRVTWVPHAAGPDFLLPLRADPDPVVFVSGAMLHPYPLRRAMRDVALRRPSVARLHEHPGYDCTFDYATDARVGSGYASAIQSCLAAFTDALVHEYLVAKHFEIPATGALLIADRAVSAQLLALGFIDGTHYLSTTLDDLESVVDYAVSPSHRAEIDEIRAKGHALVHSRHAVGHRAEQIDRLIGS